MDKHYVVWLLLIAITGWCIFWHLRENRQIEQEWSKKLDSNSANWLTRFAWFRTIQLLAALITSTIIIIGYDWELNDAWHALNESNALRAELEKKEQKPEPSVLVTATPTPAAVNAPLTNQQPQNGYYPPASAAAMTTESAAQPVVLDNASSSAAIAATEESEMNSIYNPEAQQTDMISRLDALKKRYEDILVTHFFMRKCNRAGTADYHIIISALSQEMASINAPGRLQNDILTAAQGSYHEMYARSECAAAGVDQLYAQYTSFIASLAANFSAP